MKKQIVLFLLFSLVCLCSFSQQNNKPNDYTPLVNYKGDVAKYLYDNFYINEQNYIGKPLQLLFNKLEVPISYSILIPTHSEGYDKITYGGDRISLFFSMDKNDTIEGYENKINLSISFTPIANIDSINFLIRKSKKRGEWTNERANFYGKFKITDIILHLNSNKIKVSTFPNVKYFYNFIEQHKLYKTERVTYLLNDSIGFILSSYNQSSQLNSFDIFEQFCTQYYNNKIDTVSFGKKYENILSNFKRKNKTNEKNNYAFLISSINDLLEKYNTGLNFKQGN